MGAFQIGYHVEEGENVAVGYQVIMITQAGSIPNTEQFGGDVCTDPYTATYTISDGGDVWYPLVFWDQSPTDGIYESMGYWFEAQVPYNQSMPVNLHVIDENFVHDIKSFNINAPASQSACENP